MITLILTVVFLVLATFVLKVLWVVRMGTLAHWSYLIGSALYPSSASKCVMLTLSLFGFMSLGSLLPEVLFPRMKLVATAMSVPAQLHMLFLLHRQVSRRLNNDTVTKSVQAYTVLALLSTVWTIVTLIWIYQSNRHYARLRRIDLIRQQELQNGNCPELENGYPSIYS